MKGRMKTTFLVLGAACFMAMASGLVLHFHLAHLDEPAEHDSDHCPLCRQLLVSKKDYTVDPEPATVASDPVGHLAATPSPAPIYQASPNRFHPRAPPA